MRTYDELKDELYNIAKVVELFPGEVRERAFDLLVSGFLGEVVGPPSISSVSKESTNRNGKKSGAANTSRGKGKAAKEVIKLNTSLDLRGNSQIPAFKAFNSEKAP